MASRIPIRPRLLIVSLVTALVAIVLGMWFATQVGSDEDGADDVDARMDEPGEYTEPIDEGESQAGEAFPDVAVLDVDDNAVQTGSLVGTPLVVNVWYSNCAPCVREMPALVEVDEEYDDDQVRFVGIDPQDDVGAMLDFAEERDVAYDLYRDDDGAFVDAGRVINFPTTFFVDADGTIVEHHAGEITADGLRENIEAML